MKSPWLAAPYRLISWWNMNRYSAGAFMTITSQLEIIGHYAKNASPSEKQVPLESEVKQIFADAVKQIQENCSSLGLAISIHAADRLSQKIDDPSTLFEELADPANQLRRTIQWEMEEMLFFHMPSERKSFYDQKELFGLDVSKKTPAVQYDMVEAGNCYAMGRSTACVFHLMRIMEVGVQEFGAKLGVSLAKDKNWQNILDETNKAIRALPPKDAATKTMSEISANLYAVKLAWRNEVMHPKDTYTLEEAENLIRQVKLFMGQLATII